MEKEHVRELYEFYEEKMQQEIITDELLKLGRKIIIKTDEFNEELSKEQQEKLEELLELEHERGAALDTEVFIYAFSLATQLFAEGLISNKKRNERNKYE